MIANQVTLNLSPYITIYDLVVPQDNMLRQINDLVDFSFVLEELKNKYCQDNGRNAVPPIRMFNCSNQSLIYRMLMLWNAPNMICLLKFFGDGSGRRRD